MNIFGSIILGSIITFTVLGFIIGLCKGFSNSKSWGVEFLIAALLSSLVGSALAKEATAVKGIITIVLAIGAFLLLSLFSSLIRKGFQSSKRRKIARGKKVHGSGGFFDSVFGGVSLAVKGFVISAVVSCFVLVALDLSQFAFVTEHLADIYSNPSWIAFKPFMMDFFYVGVIALAVKCGFSGGISNTLWVILVFGMIIFAALAAYHLAFNIPSFDGAVSGLAGLFAGEGEISEMNIAIARWALAAGLFLLMLVVVVLIGIFVPKLLGAARNSKIFYVIDGVFGSVFATAVVLGILLVLGNIVQPLSVDLEAFPFMAQFSSYFETSGVATYFYNNDLLTLMGIQPLLPLAEWLS
ncbi:MAG: hypothetical protein K2L42_01490 [Clostridia bacterium]|nr:hypothetical protein [Clostridia bacterium]